MSTPGYFFPARAAIQYSPNKDIWARAGSSAPVPAGGAIGDIAVWDGTAYVAADPATGLGIGTGYVPTTPGILIGTGAGIGSAQNNQIAIGQNSPGTDATGADTIAIGTAAGRNQAVASIAIGRSSGALDPAIQGSGSIAIGQNAGNGGQAANCIAVGVDAASGGAQASEAIAIGANAGQLGQGDYSISIGAWNVNTQQQGNECISLGFQAGKDQYSAAGAARSIAIGSSSGNSQGNSAIAIGNGAASYSVGAAPNQGDFSVALGYDVGGEGTLNACSVGVGKGAQLQGASQNAIAIGTLAGSGQPASAPQDTNSIVISAASTTVATPSVGANTCVIKPIGGTYVGAPSVRTLGAQSLFYDGTTGEVTAGNLPQVATSVGTFNTASGGTLSTAGTFVVIVSGNNAAGTFTAPAGYNDTNSIIIASLTATGGQTPISPLIVSFGGTTVTTFLVYGGIFTGIIMTASYQFVKIVP